MIRVSSPQRSYSDENPDWPPLPGDTWYDSSLRTEWETRAGADGRAEFYQPGVPTAVVPADDVLKFVGGMELRHRDCSCPDAYLANGVPADGCPTHDRPTMGSPTSTEDVCLRCACGHLWLLHDVEEYRGDGSETCCVEGCPQTGCPGRQVTGEYVSRVLRGQ